MDKQDILIGLTILILIATMYGISLTKQALPSGPDISFFLTRVREEDGRSLNYLCSSVYECQFDLMKEIIEDNTYYSSSIYFRNDGKRINNVVIDFACDNIDFYGVTKIPKGDFEIQQVYDFSTKIFFPWVDNLNPRSWEVIFKANESVKNLTCDIRLVSDEIGRYDEEITVEID